MVNATCTMGATHQGTCVYSRSQHAATPSLFRVWQSAQLSWPAWARGCARGLLGKSSQQPSLQAFVTETCPACSCSSSPRIE
jgi:hypothetical protein